MNHHEPRLVPKVHPATRAAEPEDPMELCATATPGEPELMLRCTVEEYAREGWPVERIVALFADPAYPALHALGTWLGPAELRRRVERIVAQCGTFRVQVVEAPDELDCVPQQELVQLEIPQENFPLPRESACRLSAEQED